MSAHAALVDDAARRLARERFDRPILLEAGAGTGKTSALVARLLVWLLDAGWRDAEERLALRSPDPAPREVAARALDGVVAITFTEAAAAEMAARLADSLSTIARGEPPARAPELLDRVAPDELAARAIELGEQLGRARIQTIHAFCRALLAAHPFDAGVHPAFSVDADGAAAERVAFETVAARFSERLAAEDDDWLALLRLGHDARDLFEATLAALQRGVDAADLSIEPFPAELVARRIAEVRAPLSALRTALASVVPGLKSDSVASRVLDALAPIEAEFASNPAADGLEAASRLADELCAAEGTSLRGWARGKSTKTIDKLLAPGVKSFAQLAADAVEALDRLRALRPVELERARRVVGALVGEARERLDRDGFLLYDDLLDRAAKLLERRADVRRAVRRGIRQLLVDEFQDTDRRQCALVEALALDGAEDERPGLFVVGDPKQSIYGWRDADLEAYERFLAKALAAGALSARLEVNFRSTPALLDEVARTIAPSFVPEAGLQPGFERLSASPEGVARGAAATAAGAPPAVELWLSLDPKALDKTRSGAATAIEARAVARDLVRRRERDPALRWSEFALLARTGSDLERYLEALREADIPFAVERDRSYWRRREIIDAAALVRAVIEPGDTLALVTFLRSPFVGVPDAAWLPLWERKFPELLARLVAPEPVRVAELAGLLSDVAAELSPAEIPGLARIAGWEESAAAAVEALAELRERFGRESAERFVERLRARLALEPIAAARFLGRFGLANLERFLRELEEALERGGDDPSGVARLLQRAVTERRAAEEAKPPAASADAVRVMTIHRAKGLEFETVYLVQTHKGEGSDRTAPAFDVERRGAESLEYLLLGCRTLGWHDAVRRRAEIARHEKVRLLYVAATRAKDRLVIAGQPHLRHESERTFLPLLKARFAPVLGEEKPVLPFRDEFGALWRAPALEPDWNNDAASSRAGTDTPPIDDPAWVAGNLDRLTALRTGATARAARPLFVRASDLGGFEADDELRRQEDSSSPSDDQDEKQKASIEGVGDRALARARGVALHRALELHLLAESDIAAWRERVRASFVLELPAVDAAALEALTGDADRLRLSLLWKQLSLLSEVNRIEARELPLLLAADSFATDGPIAGTVGTLDLLYRDLDSGELVVADFKSDEIAGDAAIAEKITAYGPQLELYGRAVRSALGLEETPRLELWLLDADRIVAIPPSRAAGAGESG